MICHAMTMAITHDRHWHNGHWHNNQLFIFDPIGSVSDFEIVAARKRWRWNGSDQKLKCHSQRRKKHRNLMRPGQKKRSKDERQRQTNGNSCENNFKPFFEVTIDEPFSSVGTFQLRRNPPATSFF